MCEERYSRTLSYPFFLSFFSSIIQVILSFDHFSEEIFETVFQTKNQTVLILRVHLPSSVTNESLLLQPPAMSLIGVRATHPWIDSSMKVVGFQPISSIESWNAGGLPLGKVVKDVVQHFQLNPPTILEILDPSVQKIQPSTASVKSSGESINQNNAVRKLPSTTLPPTYEQFVRSSGVIQSDSKKMEEIISLYMVQSTCVTIIVLNLSFILT